MRSSEVTKQSFKQKLNGYSKEEVNNFQYEVRQTIENLETSNQHLQQELYDTNQKLEEFVGKEETLNRSIVVAQEAADRLRANALSEAEAIITKSEEEAERILTESAQKATAVNTETDNLQETARIFLHQTRGLINFAKESLDNNRWQKIFDETPIGTVDTPVLDDVLEKYQLPVRNNQADVIFATEKEAVELEQLVDGIASNNDKPAIFPEDVEAILETKGKESSLTTNDVNFTENEEVNKNKPKKN